MANVIPVEPQKALSGVDHLTDKQALVEHAREQGADRNGVEVLEALPDRDDDAPTT